MKKCPRCNELIGDELEICPICHTKFTEKQLEEMIYILFSGEIFS